MFGLTPIWGSILTVGPSFVSKELHGRDLPEVRNGVKHRETTGTLMRFGKDFSSSPELNYILYLYMIVKDWRCYIKKFGFQG